MNKKLFKFFLICCLSLSTFANAQVRNIADMQKNTQRLNIAGFINYPPFGIFERSGNYYIFHSVFENIVSELAQNTQSTVTYFNYTGDNYSALIDDVNSGEYDLLLGAYSNTKLYERVELIFPSILNNPVTVITLQENALKITKADQLKNLKGAVCLQDHFTDFVSNQMKDYNLEKVETPYEMFEKLFTRKVDYLFMTQYFGLIEAIKLGLRKKLSFSKQSIWNMPMFFGISKFSQNRRILTQKLSSYSNLPQNKEKLEQHLRELIRDYEIKYQGVVPPNFANTPANQENVQQNDILS